MVTSNLMDAIRVAKENERNASAKYAGAAENLHNPLATELFIQLSGFEKFHFEKLVALEKSLQENGEFIHYEGKEFPLPPVFEIKAAEEPDKKRHGRHHRSQAARNGNADGLHRPGSASSRRTGKGHVQ